MVAAGCRTVGASTVAAGVDIGVLTAGARADAHATGPGLDDEDREAADGCRLHALGETMPVSGEVEMRGKAVVRRKMNLMDPDSQHFVDQLAPHGRVSCAEHRPQAPRPFPQLREFVVEAHDANQGTGEGGRDRITRPRAVDVEVDELLGEMNPDHVVMVERHRPMTSHWECGATTGDKHPYHGQRARRGRIPVQAMIDSTEKKPGSRNELPWTFPVADRLHGVRSSPVREILSILSRDGVISFAGGIPDPELFAVDEIRAAFDYVLTHQAGKALQYASTEGEPALREQAAERVSRQLPTSAEQIQVTSGSQEGLYLIGQALLDPGDVVLVERPTYLAAVQAFAMSGAQMIGIPADDHGILPEDLEQLIERHRPKFVYLIPTFQNPTGACMPASRRRQVAEVLLRTGTALVEDDPYGQLRFSGEPVTPIGTLPGMPAQTLLLNSMSKIMAPGLRVGWIRGEGPILRSIAVAKQAVGLQSPVTDQLAVARYLATNDVDQHIRGINAVYKTRRDAMHAELSGILPEGATTTSPDGGMFLWARLGNDINTGRLLPLAVEEGVAFVPGSAFYANDPDHTTMRLSYVTNSVDVIAEGIQRLSRAIETYSAQPGPAIANQALQTAPSPDGVL